MPTPGSDTSSLCACSRTGTGSTEGPAVQQLGALPPREGGVFATFSPDGRRLATWTPRGTVEVFSLDVDEALSLADGRVTRDFTATERERYAFEAVAEAYGWGDDWRAGLLTDDEILARLFHLNQARAANA